MTASGSSLPATFRGEVIEPGHSAYDEARRVWNARYDRRPALIVRPAGVDDVVSAIRFGRERDLEIAIRSGGHSASGHSTCEGGLVLDLSLMRGVTVDPERRIARANGGALLGELDIAAQAHGLVCPVGVIGHTGVAGLTLGGGIGRLQRHFGLTIDNLRAVELVTADGRRVRASETEEPELFWGIRGAGANFGLVTALEFGLHEFGPLLHRGVAIYPATRIHEVWGRFRHAVDHAPATVSFILGIGRAEPAADYPPEVAGEPIAILAYNHSGDAASVERDIAVLGLADGAVAVSSSSQPYLEVQTANDLALGWGRRSSIKGGQANDLRPATLDAAVEVAARAPGAASFSITAQGGAIAVHADDAMAFTGRAAAIDVSADSDWDDAADDERNLGWVREAMAVVERDLIVGRYINENDDDTQADVRASYGEAKLQRLRALKRAWDPDNIFRLNHNIAP